MKYIFQITKYKHHFLFNNLNNLLTITVLTHFFVDSYRECLFEVKNEIGDHFSGRILFIRTH